MQCITDGPQSAVWSLANDGICDWPFPANLEGLYCAEYPKTSNHGQLTMMGIEQQAPPMETPSPPPLTFSNDLHVKYQNNHW